MTTATHDIDQLAGFFATRLEARGYDGRNPYNMRVMSRWAAKHYSGDRDRGLCILGIPGVGKSRAVMALAGLRAIRLYNARQLAEEWQRYGVDRRPDFWQHLDGLYRPDHDPFWRDVIIDDIGSEPTLNEYGTKQEVMDAILDHRMQEMDRAGALTVTTSNLGINALATRYGARFVSRLHGLCHIVTFRGTDQRKERE